tara:strand:+ start:1620 stop:1826 length:207 start_codon:yes stop_codon:yes gene_type:complete
MIKPTRSNIKKVFKKHNVQLGSCTMDMIEQEMMFLCQKMAKRCVVDNVKRLTPELFWIAMGNYNESSN